MSECKHCGGEKCPFCGGTRHLRGCGEILTWMLSFLLATISIMWHIRNYQDDRFLRHPWEKIDKEKTDEAPTP